MLVIIKDKIDLEDKSQMFPFSIHVMDVLYSLHSI